MVNKATYDPELDKALLQEKQAQMAVRKTFRDALAKSEASKDKAYFDKRITSIAYTELTALIKQNYDWLEGNQDATALEISEKIDKFNNDILKLLVADKPRQFFSNTLALYQITFNLLYNQNKISEEVFKKASKSIEKEQAFLQKNPNENLESYTARLDAFMEEYPEQKPLLQQNKETAIQILKSENAVSLDVKPITTGPNPKQIAKDKEKVELTTQNKEIAQGNTFDAMRVLTAIVKYSTIAFLVTILLCYIVYCGSLAANYSIVRPVAIRILFFMFGILAWIPVALYFKVYVSAIQRKQLFYNSGSYLIPLFEYDPTKELKSAFERLVWFPTTPALVRAREEYLQGLEKMIS